MNHTTTVKNLVIVAILAAITAALTGTIAMSIQNAAAQNNATDIENSGTNFKFKQKEKNNCSGFTVCCNAESQSIGLARIPLCPTPIPPP
jgi:hypothetical protein